VRGSQKTSPIPRHLLPLLRNSCKAAERHCYTRTHV
jgi:hypothetical protein